MTQAEGKDNNSGRKKGREMTDGDRQEVFKLLEDLVLMKSKISVMPPGAAKRSSGGRHSTYHGKHCIQTGNITSYECRFSS